MEKIRPLLRSLGLVLGVASLPSVMAAEPNFTPPPEFTAPGKWATFKAFWQRLDAISPQEYKTREKKKYEFYDAEHQALYRAMCKILGDETYCPGLLDTPANKGSLETQMLIRLMQLRIRLLSGYGHYDERRCFQCRMAPLPVEAKLFQLAYQQSEHFQERAHALAKLRQSGQINEAIAARTLESLQREASLALSLEALPRYPFAYRPNQSKPAVSPSPESLDAQDEDESVDKWLASIEVDQKTQDRLAALRAAHSRLNALLTELER